MNKGRYLLRTVRDESVKELKKLGELIKVDDTYFYLLKSDCSIGDIVKIKMVDIIDANGYKLTTQ